MTIPGFIVTIHAPGRGNFSPKKKIGQDGISA